MSIVGAHMLFYTSEANGLCAMLRDVYGFKHVDAGGGWLIFAFPPAERGVHQPKSPITNRSAGIRFRLCATTSSLL